MRSNHARKHQPLEPEDELTDDLADLKRRAEAAGVTIQFANPDAEWTEPEPLPLKGITLSEVVIRLRRGGEL